MKDKPSTKINFYVPLEEKAPLLEMICEMMAYYDQSMSKIIRIAVKEKHSEFSIKMLPYNLTKRREKKTPEPDPIMELEIMCEVGKLRITEEELFSE